MSKLNETREKNELSKRNNANIDSINSVMKKKDLWLIEDLARRNHNMIKQNETFFRIPD
jgi:cell division protein FtsB